MKNNNNNNDNNSNNNNNINNNNTNNIHPNSNIFRANGMLSSAMKMKNVIYLIFSLIKLSRYQVNQQFKTNYP